MTSKLEKLALCVRRPKSYYDEWMAYDTALKRYEMISKEDRTFGNFPYDDDSVPGITEFYSGKDILITGGTGFIGKVLIEKLLRSLPEGGRIFLLLRGRKGVSPQERLQAMLDLPIFKLVMTENPDAAKRLVVVEGDCGSVGLSLSPADKQTLIDNVSVVFHCAATVRFDLTTNHMILINTRGTREMIYLCRQLKKLEAFVHVSTAFCNATRDMLNTEIPEKVLRQEVDWRMIIATAEKTERDLTESSAVDLIFPKLSSKHQNNYTFTKALAEDVVEDEANDLPVVIVRPTVVISSYEDPFPGWVDNLYGPMSIWDGVGQGVVQTHYGKIDIALDYVPVDMSAKILITAAWHRGIGFRASSEPEKVDVINNGAGDVSLHTSRKLAEKMQELFDKHSHRYIFRYPHFFITDISWIFWLLTIVLHIPLGIFVDTILRLKGRKPILLSIYRRLYFAQTKLLHYFSSNQFKFDLTWQWKVQARITKKKDKDRFLMATENYPMAYYHDNIAGIIKYVFKEKTFTAEQSNRNIMYYVDRVQNAFLVVLGLWILSWLFPWTNITA